MGASSSKADNANSENANANRMSMEIVLDKGVKQQIDRLSEYVSFFNKNDVDSLLSVVDTYANNLKTSTGQTYQLSNIKRFVGKFHEELLEKITKDSPNMTAEEKKVQLGEKLKDSKLPDILKTTYDERLSKLKTEILGSPLVVKDRQMGQSIERIFTDITGIKSKYKYFEYRYIQLNLFLIVFIQHVFSTMDKFINSVLAYTVTRDRTRQDSMRQLIDLLLEIMRQAELNIDQKDFEAIDKLMSVVETEIKQKQKNLGEAVDKARVEALDEMLKLVVANHDMFADQATQGMSNPESTDDFVNSFSMRLNKAPSSLSVSAGPAMNQVGEQGFGLATNSRPGKSSEPFNTKSNRTPGDGLVAYGGFVRDHSRFPQAFYELNSSTGLT